MALTYDEKDVGLLTQIFANILTWADGSILSKKWLLVMIGCDLHILFTSVMTSLTHLLNGSIINRRELVCLSWVQKHTYYRTACKYLLSG